MLDVTLDTALARKTSRVEERVNGTLASPVVIDGVTAIPAGAKLTGHVTNVEDSAKIKGRAELALAVHSPADRLGDLRHRHQAALVGG